MKRFRCGNKAGEGYYMNLATAEFVTPDIDTHSLPGTIEDSFIKVPFWFPVMAGPVFGLIYVILLPLIGIVGLFSFLAYKVGFASTNIGRVVLHPILKGLRQDQIEGPPRIAREK
jgi:hypothetical protein